METTFLDRLKAEEADLGDKISKLSLFMGNESKFEKVSKIQQVLLNTQLDWMIGYHAILMTRIDDLENAE